MSFLDAVKRAIGHSIEKPVSGFRPGGDDAMERLVRELMVWSRVVAGREGIQWARDCVVCAHGAGREESQARREII